MEKALAKVRFGDLDAGGDGETSASEFEDSGSEEERETRHMVTQRNRKGKKSGGFQSMGLSHRVFKGVMKKGYRVPTPIQRKCIPLAMDGKDVVAMARTGSGKTAAFLIPMFERLKTHSAKIGSRALILSPTRELAAQTMKFTKELGKFTDFRAALVLGGDRMENQFAAMHENPDVIIATPGRFLHLMVEMELQLSSVEFVVFDEADRLFEMGFYEQLHEIIHRLPEARQTLLFSATLPKILVEFAKAGLKDPVLVRLDVDSKLSEQLKTVFFAMRSDNKSAMLLHLLHHVVSPDEQTVVFTATKHHVEYLKELLSAAGISSSFIYSSLDQTARKINAAKFVNKKTMVMIVTDVAARGIDIPMLDNVINYNFPSKPKLFVHRVGRVARAGRSGTAYSLLSPDELPYLLDLHLFLGKAVTLATPGSEERSGVLGSVPHSVLGEEDEFIQQIHQTSSDLAAMWSVSENAQKQYVKSRSQPAPESVKRAKELPAVIPLHPIFETQCSPQELAKTKLLHNLRTYRPTQTILEVHSTSKTTAKQVMRTKRAHHGGAVAANKEKATPLSGTANKGTPSSDDDVAKRDEHYIHYTPSDLYSEKGLSLGSSFDQVAAGAVLDVDGDDGSDMKRSTTMTKWDRKRKKFVGDRGREGQKRIKTESGRWISASYKSNSYKDWKERHKIDTPLVGMEEEEEQVKASCSKRVPRASRGRGWRKGGPGLKSKDDILKKRGRKEFQERQRRVKKQHKGRRKAAGTR